MSRSSRHKKAPTLAGGRALDVKTFDGDHGMNITTVVDMRKFVEARDGKAFTTSQQVAQAFGKQHHHVMQKVEALECSDQFLTSNFSRVQFEHRGNTYEALEMTKDGFMFLVMGFTGKSAAFIKEGYIRAFNEMAELLNLNPETLVGDLVGAVIGTSGEHVLDRVIDQKASAIPQSLQRSFKHTMKSRLRSRFNVHRTALIPAECLSEACNFVVAYAVEGEWIGRREKGGIFLSDEEVRHLYLLMSRHFCLMKDREAILSSARSLESRALMRVFDQINEGRSSFAALDARRSEIYSIYQSNGASPGGYAIVA